MWSLIPYSNGSNLEKQSANGLVDPLIYLTVMSCGRVLITKSWSLGVACVELSSSIFK